MPAIDKPIPGKAYGSIPHLIGSRMGPSDHHCEAGMVEIATVKARRNDRVIVTEKLDGACVAIAKRQGQILALIRAGYLATSSPYQHLHFFAEWVASQGDRFDALNEDERVVGEWMAMAHGTLYELNGDPFIPFDVIHGYGNKAIRLPHDDARKRMNDFDLEGARVIHDGGALSIGNAVELLGDTGFHGARSRPEGAVWRVETDGQFNFLVKWVDPTKQDGAYLPEVHSSGRPTWNDGWRTDNLVETTS